ncbi:MAG: sugar nucleotide-binding protein [Austwickia sp.]|nr:sugar nucleotide-binding protein [Austwickia sp.]MBK8437673.1 sugar nucleotide-binding protein [Austwickia sp.]MBK9099984.1 sugar nucleotide-binding protein [Austwickia sp.]
MSQLAVRESAIAGLRMLELPLHGDARGWFKENWQREKMVALGLPDFQPVQHNVAYNEQVGVTRGVHAEPWDKLISLTSGAIFGAWVDLREGPGFGRVVTARIGPGQAVFIPHGVGNSYQSLEPGTTYSYLVNRHWSEQATSSYTFVNLADPALAIPWPIPLSQSIQSAADRAHPPLAQVTPVPQRRTVVLGAGGQLGRALAEVLPEATCLTRNDLDLTSSDALKEYGWHDVGVIINAAAYTAVDAAETESGRRDCWAVNVTGVGRLVEICRRFGITLVNFSSDYVYDGTLAEHDEDEPVSPLGVYGQTKAAGDALVATWQRHYTIRTSWVVGQGRNFVATLASLARSGVSPTVVDDQFGRLTFAEDLAAGAAYLVATGAPYGTYNLTSGGPVQSWADIAADVFDLCGRARADVTGISSREYAEGKNLAPRPQHSALRLDKILQQGFRPGDRVTLMARHAGAVPGGQG